jgi:hypothetical protein
MGHIENENKPLLLEWGGKMTIPIYTLIYLGEQVRFIYF